MASSARLVFAIAAVGLTLGCGGSVRRFPLREPMWRDPDLDPIARTCHADPKPDNPQRRVCTPETYESSFAWDGADNLVFRPVARFFAVDPPGPAANVNSMDEVADSSWFTNRIGRRPMTPAEVASGYCGEQVLDPNGPDGSWIIDQGKMNGANPGFRVNIPGLGKFMLKSDPRGEPERATGATAIATRIYHAAGYWAPCDSVVYFRPSILKLKPGLTVTDNTNTTRPLDEKALTELLSGASRRDGLVRMVASRWLPGRTIGPFKYEGVRDDDPSDVVPHEDRRELRGARLLAAWLAHFDSREQNTMATWMSADEKDPDGSPGHVRHWYIDLGDCFGSEWKWDGISRRLNHAYYLDFPYLAEDFVTLGIIERPWDRAARSPEGNIFGYFHSRDFDPELWRGGYPNPAFNRMSEGDGAWMARIIARFTKEHVEAAVAVGDYTDPRHEPFLVEHLLVRRQRILERYLSKLSPLADVRVDGAQLCAVDLARSTGTFPAHRFQYAARVRAGAGSPVGANVTASPDGGVCVALPHGADLGSAPDDAPARYTIVDVANGQAPGPLRAHLYDLGAARGWKLVGIERP
jgi:hypothetical protein